MTSLSVTLTLVCLAMSGMPFTWILDPCQHLVITTVDTLDTHADELGLRDAPARHVGGAAGEVGVDVGQAGGPQLLLHHLTQIPAPGHNSPDTGDTHNTLSPALRLSQSTQELISESKIR